MHRRNSFVENNFLILVNIDEKNFILLIKNIFIKEKINHARLVRGGRSAKLFRNQRVMTIQRDR